MSYVIVFLSVGQCNATCYQNKYCREKSAVGQSGKTRKIGYGIKNER